MFEKVFIYYIFYICLKRMRLNLSTKLPMFVYTFQAMWRHRPLEEYLVFVGIRAAHTSFTPFNFMLVAQFSSQKNNRKDILIINGWAMIYTNHIFNFYLIKRKTLNFTKNVKKIIILYKIYIFKFLVFENLAITFYCEVFADANAIYFITLWCIYIMNEKYEFEVLS